MRLTEKDIIQYLQKEPDRYAPLLIKSLSLEVSLPQGYRVDAVIEFSIENSLSFEAVTEVLSVATPQNVLRGARQLLDCLNKENNPDRVPLIVAPYIGARQAKILAEKGISWLDLSGNMIIRGLSGSYIERTGKPNLYRDTSPIKKIFQGTSSLVSRALLLKPEGFLSLSEIVDFINNNNANITLSTVSKVLKILEQELLITKDEKGMFVTDPEKLLDKLTEGYKNSTERRSRKSYRFDIEGFDELTSDLLYEGKDFVACGFYAAQIKGLAVTELKTIFVKDVEQFKRMADEKYISVISNTEFGNFIVTETKNPGIWFNASFEKNASVVDDIELYIEMMLETPRGPKIAEQLKKRILEKWKGVSPEGVERRG